MWPICWPGCKYLCLTPQTSPENTVEHFWQEALNWFPHIFHVWLKQLVPFITSLQPPFERRLTGRVSWGSCWFLECESSSSVCVDAVSWSNNVVRDTSWVTFSSWQLRAASITAVGWSCCCCKIYLASLIAVNTYRWVNMSQHFKDLSDDKMAIKICEEYSSNLNDK